MNEQHKISFPGNEDSKVAKIMVSEGSVVKEGQVLMHYRSMNENGTISSDIKKLKATFFGTVCNVLVEDGDIVNAGVPVLELTYGCQHRNTIFDLCTECGANLEKEQDAKITANENSKNSYSMIHTVPCLKICAEEAQIIGERDVMRLLEDKKLVLLVDLDQTLIHTTHDNIPNNIKDIFHFRLSDQMWYHTRLRPGTARFLNNIRECYELHICTFGSRPYAHAIAKYLDPNGDLFGQRILSRDECFDPTSKTANLKELFPCGDSLVCIIDDREDVWEYASNLIHVKPYTFFQNTGDINSPFEMQAAFNKCRNRHAPQRNVACGEYSQWLVPGIEIKKKYKTLEEIAAEKEEIIKRKVAAKSELDRINVAKQSEQMSPIDGIEAMDVDCLQPTTDENVANEASGDVRQVAKNVEENVAKEANCDAQQTTDNVEENVAKEASGDVRQVANNAEENVAKEASGDVRQVANNAAKNVANEETVVANLNESEKMFHISPLVDISNNLPPPNDKEMIELEEGDDYLLHLENILKNIHREFFQQYSETGNIPDMKRVIPECKRKVLKGLKLVFSGLIPRGVKLEDSYPFKIAYSLGAEVTVDIEDDTTHMVAMKSNTQKVVTVRRHFPNIKLVTPDWLWMCAERWEHVEELLYPLRFLRSNAPVPPDHCYSPERPWMKRRYPPRPKSQCPSPSSNTFAETINPLMTFSSDDIAEMADEVDVVLSNESESDTGSSDGFESSSDLDHPKPDAEESLAASSSLVLDNESVESGNYETFKEITCKIMFSENASKAKATKQETDKAKRKYPMGEEQAEGKTKRMKYDDENDKNVDNNDENDDQIYENDYESIPEVDDDDDDDDDDKYKDNEDDEKEGSFDEDESEDDIEEKIEEEERVKCERFENEGEEDEGEDDTINSIFRRGEAIPDDIDLGDNSSDDDDRTNDSVWDNAAEAIERYLD